uniref:Putative transmembrane protein n=1 Tax=Burkholderia sp. (strain CCGE1003) TaxID=640512 RepID=E1T6N0_BURSG
MAVSTRTKRGARPLIVTLIVIVVIAGLGFAYASPYIALNNLKRAADARDAQTVNQYVDFPALRESLKQQVTGLLTRRLDSHGSGNPLAAIGAMIGVALIGPLVDAYATPDGVAALLNGIPPRGEPGERPPAPPAAQNPAAANGPASAPPGTSDRADQSAGDSGNPAIASNAGRNAAPPQPPQTTAGYRGLNEFAVTYQHGAGDARYSAIFMREGLFTWKLAAINLNE